jgi:hypothetical protein
MDPAAHDVQLRQSAFDQVNLLATLRGILDSADLDGWFKFGGERIPLINPTARDIQAATDATPAEHQDRVLPARRAGLLR